MKKEALALADELEHGVWYKNPYTEDKMDEASAMIRRLVEELDKQGEPYVWHMKSNDPDSVKDYWYFIEKPSRESKISHRAIPLYTTPQTKPLSDEEIISIRDSCYVQSGIDEWEFDDLVFAKAIEERHGIK